MTPETEMPGVDYILDFQGPTDPAPRVETGRKRQGERRIDYVDSPPYSVRRALVCRSGASRWRSTVRGINPLIGQIDLSSGDLLIVHGQIRFGILSAPK